MLFSQISHFTFVFLAGVLLSLAPSTHAYAAPAYEPMKDHHVLDPAMAAAAKARIQARQLRQEQFRSKRLQVQIKAQACPGTEHACKLPSGGFECLDVTQELNTCGACLEQGGQDCEKIPHAFNVSCAKSRCIVETCRSGWRPNEQKSACIPDPSQKYRHRRAHRL